MQELSAVRIWRLRAGFRHRAAGQARHRRHTTCAVENVVLGHLEKQLAGLEGHDPDAHAAVFGIVEEEREHRDHGQALLQAGRFWPAMITPAVRLSTETVIWLGMRL
ncbi:MAG: demethoxyubiquinone hydroxylase family protein [Pseudoxanthomonas sp.]